MEENLNNQQVRPGDETQLMRAVFSSDDEMMAFYLTLYRLMYPGSYLVQSTDKKRLEELKNMLYKNASAFEVVNNYQSISVKEVIKGLGLYMADGSISKSKRLQIADVAGDLMNCLLETTKNIGQFRYMNRVNMLHIENVTYLLKKFKGNTTGEKKSEVVM